MLGNSCLFQQERLGVENCLPFPRICLKAPVRAEVAAVRTRRAEVDSEVQETASVGTGQPPTLSVFKCMEITRRSWSASSVCDW